MTTSPRILIKEIFLVRLYSGLTGHRSHSGFTTSILQVLNEVALTDQLLEYMMGGPFPSKQSWKQMVRHGLESMDYDQSYNAMDIAYTRYKRQMCIENHLKLHPLYGVVRRSKDIKLNNCVLWWVRPIALPDTTYDGHQCKLCQQPYTDIVTHLISQCTTLVVERNELWDFLVNELDVELSATLFNLADEEFSDIICGRVWNLLESTWTTSEIDKLYSGISALMKKLYSQGFRDNYIWIRDY